ncbi:MAG TPA: helix-turn-helix domain-containing protein [Nitrospiria bacterium]|nr:helix-turn-helix domain-containing protein [Nitrospiria bacterium]
MLTPHVSLKKAVEVLERELIIKAMEENSWVMARAARHLDVSERILAYKVRKYQIRKFAG